MSNDFWGRATAAMTKAFNSSTCSYQRVVGLGSAVAASVRQPPQQLAELPGWVMSSRFKLSSSQQQTFSYQEGTPSGIASGIAAAKVTITQCCSSSEADPRDWQQQQAPRQQEEAQQHRRSSRCWMSPRCLLCWVPGQQHMMIRFLWLHRPSGGGQQWCQRWAVVAVTVCM